MYIMQYPGAAERLIALFATALPSSLHLCFISFLTWMFYHLANIMFYQCVSSSAASFWMCIKMHLKLYLHVFINWHDHTLLFILKSMENT